MQHVLGVGSIGSLLASQLSRSSQSPVRLIVRNRDFYRDILSTEITIERDGLKTRTPPLPVELLPGPRLMTARQSTHPEISERRLEQERQKDAALQSLGAISSLFVTTKAQAVVPALQLLQPRLSRDSTIVLLQNGGGLVDAVIDRVFPDEDARPSFIVGINSHGAFVKDYPGRDGRVLHTVWAGMGEIAFGVLPNQSARRALEAHAGSASSSTASNGNPLVDLSLASVTPSLSHLPYAAATSSLHATVSSLLACTALNPSWLPYPKLLEAQLQKVAINCVINPLTTILRTKNGRLAQDASLERLAYGICDEASRVFAQRYLRHTSVPATADGGGPGSSSADRQSELEALRSEHACVAERGEFPPGHPLNAHILLDRAMQVANKTAQNISSMLQDLYSRRSVTEMEYLNGYVSKLGSEYGIPTPLNDSMVDLVNWTMARGYRGRAGQESKPRL